MLFDLSSGRRKRVVQVIYSILALLMGGGLVFFGIGSDVNGGLFDAFDGGGDGGSNSQFADDAQKIEERLQTEPRNPDLLVQLVRLRYFAGNDAAPIDPQTGQQSFTDEAFTQFQASADAWDRYLATKPKKPNVNTAGLAATSSFYAALSSEDVDSIREELDDAVEAQRIAAEGRPNLNSYLTLARYAYYAGDTAAAEAAGEKAKAEAPGGQRSGVASALAAYAEEGKSVQQQIRAFAATQQGGQGGEEALQNPLGELSGSGSSGP
jgi:hypothetical protein